MTPAYMLEGNLEPGVEETIETLREEPEFQDVDAFIAYKLENDEYEFSFLELQALARNFTQKRTKRPAEVAEFADVEAVKNELTGDMGFKYVARNKIQQTRGFTSPLNSTSRWAGTGGGGSGFGSDFGGGGFTAFGGGGEWDPKDKKSLSMGSRKKK